MATCILYDIVDPDVQSLKDEHWSSLFTSFEESTWIVKEGQRIGIVNPIRHQGVIAAYFANEGIKETVQYDDNKEQIDVPPTYSFEHLFFALLEDPPQFLIQRRNIYDYANLSLGIIRGNLLDLLYDFFLSAGVYIVGNKLKIESAGMKYTDEQMYGFFVGAQRVSRIYISNLKEAQIPPEDDPRYKLFNPKDEWNPITWGAVHESQEAGLDEVEMKASDDQDSTLQSPIPKSLAASGEINAVEGTDNEGRIFYQEKTQDAEIKIDLQITPQTNPELIVRLKEAINLITKRQDWEERRNRRLNNGMQDDYLPNMDE